MSNRHVSPFRAVWNFVRRQRVLRKQSREQCVGVDQRGNKYYLRYANKEFNIRESRYVMPSQKDLDSDMIPLARNIPPEWESWLRGRRPDPPSEEELHKVEVDKLKIQQRVKELEMKERVEQGEEEEGLKPQDGTKHTQTIEGDTSKKSFPTYEEFEIHPGQFAKDKDDPKR